PRGRTGARPRPPRVSGGRAGPAPPGPRPRLGLVFNRLEGNLALGDLQQRRVGRSQVSGIRNQRASQATATRVELPDPTRHQIDEEVRVAHLLQGTANQFGVQRCILLRVLPIETSPSAYADRLCNQEISWS